MAKENLNDVEKLDLLEPVDIDSIGNHYGKMLADKYNGIKTNQVRNIYSAIIAIRTKLKNIEPNTKKLDEQLKMDLVLLKPKLAYATGRERNVKPLYELLSKAIDCVNASNDQIKGIKNFVSLVETIVAYHKFFGGKDK